MDPVDRLAADPRLIVWVELLTIAHVSGRRRPYPRAEARQLIAAAGNSRDFRQAVTRLTDAAIACRHYELVRHYVPETLGVHLTATVLSAISGHDPQCAMETEVEWQAGRFRWSDVARALMNFPGSRESGPHPETSAWAQRGLDVPGDTVDEQSLNLYLMLADRPIGKYLLFGAPDTPSQLDTAICQLSGASDPVVGLDEASAFLENAGEIIQLLTAGRQRPR